MLKWTICVYHDRRIIQVCKKTPPILVSDQYRISTSGTHLLLLQLRVVICTSVMPRGHTASSSLHLLSKRQSLIWSERQSKKDREHNSLQFTDFELVITPYSVLFISTVPTLPVSISCAVLPPRHREDWTHISQQTHARVRERKHLSSTSVRCSLPWTPSGKQGREREGCPRSTREPAADWQEGEATTGMDQHHHHTEDRWLFPAANPKTHNSPAFHARHIKIQARFLPRERKKSDSTLFFFTSLEIQVSGFMEDFSDY